MRRVYFILFILTILVAENLPARQENSYFTPDNILRFAQSLFEEKDYRRAAAEFRRYLAYSQASASIAASTYYKIGLCYKASLDFPAAMSAFKIITDKYADSPEAERSFFEIAFIHFLNNDFANSNRLIDDFLPGLKLDSEKIKMRKLKGINFLFQKDWLKAKTLIDRLSAENPGASDIAELSDFAVKGQTSPHKSPFLAGALSTVIPGAGKFYSGKPIDGIFSFLTIAITGWQAYDGFRHDGSRSLKGWIYGSMGIFLYLGNIYGSIVSVHISNQQSEQKYFETIRLSINASFK
jgi:tetratricopeptide (TPR) repeat protein